MRFLFITLRMRGSSRVNNVLWWGTVDSGGGGGCRLAAILRPAAAVKVLVAHQLLFLKFPSEEELHGIHGGTCMEKSTWAVAGLDLGGHKNPWLRSPEWNTVDWQPELLPSDCGALSKRDGLLLLTTFHGWLTFSQNWAIIRDFFFFNPSRLTTSSSQVSDLHHGLKVLSNFSRLLSILHRPSPTPE